MTPNEIKMINMLFANDPSSNPREERMPPSIIVLLSPRCVILKLANGPKIINK